MKGQYAVAIIAVAVIAVAAVACAVVFSGEEEAYPEANAGVVGIVSFDVQCNEYDGTAVAGSLFVIQDGEDIRIRLVAGFSIDEEDFVGIDIYSTPELEIESVLCSYQDNPSDEEVIINTYTRPVAGYISMVYIGWNTATMVPSGGGTGVVVVDYLYLPDDTGETFTIRFALGSDVSSSGVVLVETTNLTVEVCPGDYL